MRRAGFVFCVLLLLLTWGGALHLGQWMLEAYGGISVRLQGQGFGHIVYENAVAANADANILGVTAFNRSQALLSVQNPATGVETTARTLAVAGDMRGVSPMKLLSGGYPVMEDRYGCIIDTRVALALYGNTDVTGVPLILEGKRHVVRGVVEAKEASILLRDSAAIYTNLEFTCENLSAARESVTSFLFRYALAGDYVLIENGLYSNLLAPLCGLPGWMMGAWLLAPLVKLLWRRRTIPLQLALLALCCVGIFFLLRWLLNFRLYWPERFLPVRWSDFSFWQELVQGEAANFEAISFLTPLPKDMLWFSALRQCLLFTFIASFASIGVIRAGRAYEERAALVCVTGLSIGAVLVLHGAGYGFSPTTGYIVALPLWWVGSRLRLIPIALKNYEEVRRDAETPMLAAKLTG